MYYGFDIGGTKIAFAVYDENFTLCHQERMSTPKDDYSAILHMLQQKVLQADAQFGGAGTVGIGFPGVINCHDGSLVVVNLPALHGKHLALDLGEMLGRKVLIDNDANCFLWSEVHQGSADGASCALGVTLGTGGGGAIYTNATILHGKNFMAGEIGHITLPATVLAKYPALPFVTCGCGRVACFETYASGTGLERLYLHFSGASASGEQIVERFYAREPAALACVDCWLDILAAGLANASLLLDPDVIVLGGGLCEFSEIYQQLPARLPANLLPKVAPPAVLQAKFNAAGGVRGAALLHFAVKNCEGLL
ncbi:MAG: ROK family protein [Vibrionaceae bacterium]